MLFQITASNSEQRDQLSRHHPCNELNLILEGNSTILLGEQEYHCTPGTMLWIPGGSDHLRLVDSPDLRMLVWWWDDGAPWATSAEVRHCTGYQAVAELAHLYRQSEQQHIPPSPDLSSKENSKEKLCHHLEQASKLLAFQRWKLATEMPIQQPKHPAVIQAVYSLRAGGADNLRRTCPILWSQPLATLQIISSGNGRNPGALPHPLPPTALSALLPSCTA